MRFSSLLDIGKLIPGALASVIGHSFSSLLDIGKLIQSCGMGIFQHSFSSLLDIGKLILLPFHQFSR